MQELNIVKPILLTILIIDSGCDDEDARLAKVAREAAQRQAEQNLELSRVNREVAEATRQFVEGRANADQQWLFIQQDLDHQRNQLDAERRQQNQSRQRDSLLAPALTTLGVLLVCSLSLLLCWHLLVGLGKDIQSAEIAPLLIGDLIDSFEAGQPADHAPTQASLSDAARGALDAQTPRLPSGRSDRTHLA